MHHYRSRILEELQGIKHYISEKRAAEPLGFSLALHTGEDPALVGANRRRVAEFFGPDASFVSALQVHGDRIYAVERSESRGWELPDESLKADALITRLPKVVLTILTADCVPILLTDPVTGAVGAVHAGWKGSALKIVEKTVARLQEAYGVNPADLRAFIGPSIGGCCYEVGEEVAEEFRGVEGAVHPGTRGRPMLDLKEVNHTQLLAAGLCDRQIEISPVCTVCERERFFSYRAEGGCSGRFMSCIMREG
ncbi:peptidoglycan editing factor PgeF [Nitratifractor sp.]|uniref:peptidoglycan editing factor PgeF n=1 Tax=Nitratifractor sp. TaxID=2268144 RepID=UPI0025D26813|nr:peptidoglycan editing factor PgeF [Nitratifractor sp.]